MTSRALLDYMVSLSFCPENSHITLIHIHKEPSASQDLMGKKFVSTQEKRIKKLLTDAKNKLVESGFAPDKIKIIFEKSTYPTVSDGIVDQFNKGDFDLVVIGRKQMTKAEEFVLGDVSVKLIRTLKKAAILVVKSE
jgi:nucleotide-binding universal stress UspA family protein